MSRVTKDPDERRHELISCAQKLFYSRGYERTTVGDIVDEIGIAKGTFYYYFDSKLAILEALVDELTGQLLAMLHEIVVDESLRVLDKWGRALQVVAAWKTRRKPELLAILRMMQMDENALLRCKVRTQAVRMLSPEFATIIGQGIEEGVFDTRCAQDSAEITLSAMQTLYDDFASILLSPGEHEAPAALARRRVASVETAIERVLGAPPGSLSLIDDDTFAAWFEE